MQGVIIMAYIAKENDMVKTIGVWAFILGVIIALLIGSIRRPWGESFIVVHQHYCPAGNNILIYRIEKSIVILFQNMAKNKPAEQCVVRWHIT